MGDHAAKPGTLKQPSEPTPESLLPLEIAVEAERVDPAADSPARVLLQEQTRLVHEQINLARNERFRNRIKAARDLSLVAATLAALGAAVAVVWSAYRADGLVVEPFTTPPDLQARGLDGAAVSALLLDRVAHMQDRADSVRAPGSFENDWGEDLTVELPEAGLISVGEVYQTLRRWLGEETRVSGQVFREGSSLTIVLRAGALPAQTVTGSEAELRDLLTRAAERLYEQTQPYRYAVYLDAADRNLEAVAVLRRLLRHPDPGERAWAYNGLCHIPEAAPNARESVRLLKAGLQLEPQNTVLLGNLALYEEVLGLSEAALRTRRRILGTSEKEQNRFVDPAAIGVRVTATEGFSRYALGDFEGALEAWEKTARMRENQGHVASAPFRKAAALAALHRPAEVRRSLADLGVLDEGVAAREQPGWNLLVFPLADAAAELED